MKQYRNLSEEEKDKRRQNAWERYRFLAKRLTKRISKIEAINLLQDTDLTEKSGKL